MSVKMRNEFVMVRVVDTGKIGSVLTPQKSAEGKEYYVESFGETVKELSVGDRGDGDRQ